MDIKVFYASQCTICNAIINICFKIFVATQIQEVDIEINTIMKNDCLINFGNVPACLRF